MEDFRFAHRTAIASYSPLQGAASRHTLEVVQQGLIINLLRLARDIRQNNRLRGRCSLQAQQSEQTFRKFSSAIATALHCHTALPRQRSAAPQLLAGDQHTVWRHTASAGLHNRFTAALRYRHSA